MIKFGRNVIKSGKQIRTIKLAISAIRKGGRLLIMVVTGVCPTLEETNSILPTGGVNAPSDTSRTKITPKCTGSMPNSAAKGANSGAKIGTEAVSTIKQPTISRKITVMIKKVAVLLEKLIMAAAIFWGICLLVSTQANACAVPVTSKMAAVPFAALTREVKALLTVSCLVMKPTIRACDITKPKINGKGPLLSQRAFSV